METRLHQQIDIKTITNIIIKHVINLHKLKMGSCRVEELPVEAKNALLFATTNTISINDFLPVFLPIFVIVIEWIGMCEGLYLIVLLFTKLDKEDRANRDGKLEALIKRRKLIETNIQTLIVVVVLFVLHVLLECTETVNILLKLRRNACVSCVLKGCIRISLVHPFVGNVL